MAEHPEAQRILDRAARRILAEEPQSSQAAVSPEEWAETKVHKRSTYSCAKCGGEFDSPQAVYDHLDAKHKEKG